MDDAAATRLNRNGSPRKIKDLIGYLAKSRGENQTVSNK
jgi:hypothetical protein